LTGPSGKYCGSKDVIGAHFTNTVNIDSDSTADFTAEVTGTISAKVSCPKEGFIVDSKGNVSVPGASKSGDCIHDNLKKLDATLKSITHDSGNDSFDVVFHKIIDIDVHLTH